MNDWLSQVFSHPSLNGAIGIVGKTTVVYLFLVVGLRLLGKRELGQMTIYDLVLLIVLANAVQNAMVGNDSSLGGGIISAVTLLVINRLFNFVLSRSPKLEHLMVGEPTLIVNDGVIIENRLRREGVTHEQLMAALREHGLDDLNDVHLAILEVDGTISVVPIESTVHRSRRHFKALRLS